MHTSDAHTSDAYTSDAHTSDTHTSDTGTSDTHLLFVTHGALLTVGGKIISRLPRSRCVYVCACVSALVRVCMCMCVQSLHVFVL